MKGNASPEALGCCTACWDCSYSVPPTPHPAVVRLWESGELGCPNSERSRVRTVYSLITLNKKGV